MIFTFQNPPGYAEDTPDDFEVTQIPALPAPPNPPTIVVTNGPGANDKTLTFNVPIQPNRWTCIRHIASNARRCLGFLPGDANGNGFVLPNDILEIVDTINGVRPGGPLPIHLCDIDRSGVCLPADLIGELDLLKGFGFSRQIGKTLPPCPSTSP